MNAAGYVNYSTKSPMALGLTPTDLKKCHQTARWGRGVIRSSYNMNIFFNPKLTKGQKLFILMAIFIGGLSLDGYCISWHRFYILVFHVRVVVSNIWLLFLFWFAKLRIDTLVQCEVSKTIPNTGLGRNCGNDFCSVFVYSHDVGVPLALAIKNLKVTRKGNDTSWTLYLYALPYLVLWGLAVYGLVTFNYGEIWFRAFMEVLSVLVDLSLSSI